MKPHQTPVSITERVFSFYRKIVHEGDDWILVLSIVGCVLLPSIKNLTLVLLFTVPYGFVSHVIIKQRYSFDRGTLHLFVYFIIAGVVFGYS